uniref:Receptor kinase-like protein Xa21 n=1 Tax=Oryza meridionalis TaxID=40149 RepID=A0A0E0E387_9ORYZ
MASSQIVLSPGHGLLLFPLKFLLFLPLVLTGGTEDDRQALLCFMSQLSAPSRALASWSNTSMEFCSWQGITCSSQSPRCVIALDLSSEGITGSIPPCIANLTFLTMLQLSNNSFHGSIPPELGLLNQLSYLNLSTNSLEGNIPSELSSCSQLKILDLSNNNLQGSIPSAFGDLPLLQKLVLANSRLAGEIPESLGSSISLTYVDLGNNALTGRIPESLVNSSSLQVLRLMRNALSGQLPTNMFNSSSLTDICLQQNSFGGTIPPVTAMSSQVKYLDLSDNNLIGTMPSSIGNLSSLIYVRLSRNILLGSIPESLGHVATLEVISLNSNNLSGSVPPSLFNMSSLTFLAMTNNSLVGKIPSNIGYTLPNIQELYLSDVKFDGSIPASLLNASNLQTFNLANCGLTGSIPLLGSLPNLQKLDLGFNMFEADGWSFVSSLTNCSRLTRLMLDGNNIQGNLPSTIGNLSSDLQWLWLGGNNISGSIPPEIGNLKGLTKLYMDYNLLTGNIPPTIGNLHNLVDINFTQNYLSGVIPDAIGNLLQLTNLRLDRNNFSGSIPASIGQCTQLTTLNLAYNSLNGSIPSKIFQIYPLSVVLDLSHNYLSGGIPEEVGNLVNLNKLSISNNRLSGEVPSTLGECVLLESLDMQSNFLVGSIPQSFAKLVGIKKMDISQNKLSGKIPEFLTSFSSIYYLNLSFNNFYGEIPIGGVFSNASVVSIEGNDGLCAWAPTKGIRFCSSLADRGSMLEKLVLALKIAIPLVIISITLFCVLVARSRKGMKLKPQLLQFNQHLEQITYEDIVKATKSFSSDNLIGSGSFGMVYNGNLEFRQDQVAIKIFNLNIYGANRSFAAECEALRNVRHRNIIKIITSCSSVDSEGADFKALVFEYMKNGNLEMWLHPKKHEHSQRNALTFSQRVNIVLEVAFALDYLHNHRVPPLIHCDLKPSNILLDLDMVAYVSDFGSARFLCPKSNLDQESVTSLGCLKGTVGYIPPECGMSKEISTKADVYSFGVILLEMITGISPMDEIFSDGTSLRELVAGEFAKNSYNLIDPTMLQDEIDATEIMMNCVVPLVRTGLSCSVTSPKDRCEIGHVCSEILRIRHELSKIDGE